MIRKKWRILLNALFVFGIMFSGMSCTQRVQIDLSKENLIPKPVLLTATNSSFEITKKTSIYFNSGSADIEQTANYLAGILRPSTGFSLLVESTGKEPKSGNIYLSITKNQELGEEGYELVITEKLIKLMANKPAGLFRGVQTIRQLLPDEIELHSLSEGPWLMATGTILDFPEYEYRGAMLDVSRHFFGVDDVKKFIDHMAVYKINYLHLHLSDDQGWRIEIKSWPNLTAHGGSTEVGGGKGGFYTQEQYKELVQYAAERYITIVPEIDMPGHTNAALASYPELNCNGKATNLYTGTNVGFSTLCTKKELTYKFIDDVIGELASMTPGPYIHIGGDESHVTPLKDYIPFINRVQEIVIKHGKKIIGWDEIAHSELKPNTVVQYWALEENAKKGVSQGAKVLMSPATRTYLDMQYDSTTTPGLHWAGYTEVDSAYIWDPAKLVPGISKENILGVEAPLWTETISNMEDLEYMVFPRLPGLAEIGWTPALQRNWDEYKVRLGNHGYRMQAMGINYYSSPLVPWGE
ncbi:MAG: beta-N-acetylhexosaminidase [Bacteroidales bacterium]|nr:beta-N-acetylhexosaminidase [Bacteroidales bacterium]